MFKKAKYILFVLIVYYTTKSDMTERNETRWGMEGFAFGAAADRFQFALTLLGRHGLHLYSKHKKRVPDQVRSSPAATSNINTDGPDSTHHSTVEVY